MKDLVSIIIPTYNTNNSLERAIYSVLNQTYENIEIIVVDDNNENTPGNIEAKRILKKFEHIPNIKYIEHKKNKNGSAARNTGYRYANGEYIGFLDDDDIFYENKISKQMKVLKETNCDLCTCFYKKNDRIIKFDSNESILKNIFMLNNTPQTSSFLLKKDFYNKLNGFDESYARHQDYEFLIRALQMGTVKIIDECLYERRDNGVNNIPNAEKMELIKDKFLSQFENVIRQNKMSRSLIYGKNYGYVSFLYIKQKKVKNAFYTIVKKGNFFSIYYLIKRIIIGIYNKFK